MTNIGVLNAPMRNLGYQLQSSMQSLDRAIAILEVCARGGPELSIRDIASLTGLTRSTAHRIVVALASHALLVKDEVNGSYTLGPHLLGLAYQARSSLSVADVARPIMARLSEASGETVGFHMRFGPSRYVLDQVESKHELRRTYTDLGQPIPLHQGAPGKMLLATAPDDIVDEVLKTPLEPATANTIVEPADLRNELSRIKGQGYATSHGERVAGVRTLAVPLFEAGGVSSIALSITGPGTRFSRSLLEELVPQALSASSELSKLVGVESSDPLAGVEHAE